MDLVDKCLLKPTERPEHFLHPNKNLPKKILTALRVWDEGNHSDESSPGLCVDGFDEEQIWQQIELNNKKIHETIPKIAQFLTRRNKLWLGFGRPVIPGNSGKDENVCHGKVVGDADQGEDANSYSSEEDESEPEVNEKSSEDEDLFFNEKEMEKFVESQEQDVRPRNKKVDSDDEEEEIDYFKEDIGEDDKNCDSEIGNVGYDKFFEKPGENKSSKSSHFEQRTEWIKDKITRFEEEALDEKPWQLQGEVDATKRPVNSLLEEVVEFDMTQRPAPVITEDVTNKLEDIIIKRIKDRAFDDVERKIKPVEGPQELKKKIVLDQEKSKLSLAEVYEKEYLKEKTQANEAAIGVAEAVEELPKEKQEIEFLMTTLFKQLDCLSNFHYTPKPATAELKIISHESAVNMEEAVPDAVTDASLLAPSELAGKFRTNSLLGKEERTATDKKRTRRKKKVFQARKTAIQTLKKHSAVNFKNTSVLRGMGEVVKTSTQFFTKLQDQVTHHEEPKKRKHDLAQYKATTLKTKRLKM